jgi:hypothetical protein
MTIGVAPNPVPGGGNWAVFFGAFEEADDEEKAQVEADDAATDEQIGVVALREDSDLPHVTEEEHRFSLWELTNEEAVVVYVGSALHRHGDDPDGAGCETFHADEGQATVEDIPDDLRECVTAVLDMEIYPPGEEPVDAEPVLVEDVVDAGPNTDPGGMFQ